MVADNANPVDHGREKEGCGFDGLPIQVPSPHVWLLSTNLLPPPPPALTCPAFSFTPWYLAVVLKALSNHIGVLAVTARPNHD